MGKKMPDKKTIKELALLVTSQMGPEDKVAAVSRKIITDYCEAKININAYFEAAKRAAKVKVKTSKAKKIVRARNT